MSSRIIYSESVSAAVASRIGWLLSVNRRSEIYMLQVYLNAPQPLLSQTAKWDSIVLPFARIHEKEETLQNQKSLQVVKLCKRVVFKQSFWSNEVKH